VWLCLLVLSNEVVQGLAVAVIVYVLNNPGIVNVIKNHPYTAALTIVSVILLKAIDPKTKGITDNIKKLCKEILDVVVTLWNRSLIEQDNKENSSLLPEKEETRKVIDLGGK